MNKIDWLALVPIYEGGASTTAIGAMIGRDASNVSIQLRKAGCRMRKTKEKGAASPNKGKPLMKKRQIDYDKAAKLYEAEKSTLRVARILGCAEETVRRALVGMGVKLRNRGSLPGRQHAQYKGGTIITANGYVKMIGSAGMPHEHRLMAERALGRAMERNEVVHHINCDKTDNRPENLLICTQGYHLALHARMRKHPYWSEVERAAESHDRCKYHD